MVDSAKNHEMSEQTTSGNEICSDPKRAKLLIKKLHSTSLVDPKNIGLNAGQVPNKAYTSSKFAKTKHI